MSFLQVGCIYHLDCSTEELFSLFCVSNFHGMEDDETGDGKSDDDYDGGAGYDDMDASYVHGF